MIFKNYETGILTKPTKQGYPSPTLTKTVQIQRQVNDK